MVDRIYIRGKDGMRRNVWLSGLAGRKLQQEASKGAVTIGNVPYEIDPGRQFQEPYQKVAGPLLLLFGGGLFLLTGLFIALTGSFIPGLIAAAPGMLLFVGGFIWRSKQYTAICLEYFHGIAKAVDMTDEVSDQKWPGEVMSRVWKARPLEVLMNPPFDWTNIIKYGVIFIIAVIGISVVAAIVTRTV